MEETESKGEEGMAAPPVVEAATVPGIPSLVSVVSDRTAMTVEFAPPASDGGQPILHYVISMKPAIREVIVEKSPAVITGLIQGLLYRVAVSAVNDVGRSEFCQESEPCVAGGVPGTPMLTDLVPGDESVEVFFGPPLVDGGRQITTYAIKLEPGGKEFKCQSSPYLITGLQNGSSYRVSIAASNKLGQGAWTQKSKPCIPGGMPGSPTLDEVVPGDGSIQVSFSPPANTGGQPLTHYIVRVEPGGEQHTVPSSPAIISGLTNGMSYQVALSAANGVGRSVFTKLSDPVVPVSAPAAPTIPSDAPITISNGTVSLRFQLPEKDGGSAISKCVVKIEPGDKLIEVDTSSPCSLEGLDLDQTCSFSIAAKNVVGVGAFSNATEPVELRSLCLPGAPVIDQDIGISDGALTVSFKPSVASEARHIKNYVVRVQPGGREVEASSSPATISGLTNGEAYTLSVVAVNHMGRGAWSTESPEAKPGCLPGAPVIKSVLRGDASLSVVFIPSSKDDGHPAKSFLLRVKPGGREEVVTSSPAVVNGLENGTPYSVSLAQVNELGQGPFSPASEPCTPGALPSMPTLTSVTAGDGSVTVAFTAPSIDGGRPITHYIIRAGDRMEEVPSSPAVIQDLTNGTSYPISVAAVTEMGRSDFCAAILSMPGGVPSKPTISQLTSGDGSLTVAFIAPDKDGGQPITHYIVRLEPDGREETVTSSPAVLKKLTNGKAYTVSLAAVNTLGQGSFGSAPQPCTPAGLPGVPSLCEFCTADGAIKATILPPSNDGGRPITSYAIRVEPGGRVETVTSNTVIVEELKSGSEYTLSVAAINAFGQSGFSKFYGPIVPGELPGAPTIESATAGDTYTTINFQPPLSDGGRAIINYVVCIEPGGREEVVAASSPAVIGKLVNGTTYTLSMAAVTEQGVGPSTPEMQVTPGGLPGLPTLTEVTPGSSSISVAFSPPTKDGGRAILHYLVRLDPGNKELSCPSSPIKLNNLTNGSSYTISIAAVNELGRGAFVNSAPTMPVGPPSHVKLEPKEAIKVQDGVVYLHFHLPKNNGGSPITGCVVKIEPADRLVEIPATSPWAVDGIVAGELTSFSVAAVNNLGTGHFSKATEPMRFKKTKTHTSIVREEVPLPPPSPQEVKLPLFTALHKEGSVGPKYFLIAPKQMNTISRAFGFTTTSKANDWFKQKLKLQPLCDSCHHQVPCGHKDNGYSLHMTKADFAKYAPVLQLTLMVLRYSHQGKSPRDPETLHHLEGILDEVLGDELEEDFEKVATANEEATEDEEVQASLEKLQNLVGDAYDNMYELWNQLDPTKSSCGLKYVAFSNEPDAPMGWLCQSCVRQIQCPMDGTMANTTAFRSTFKATTAMQSTNSFRITTNLRNTSRVTK